MFSSATNSSLHTSVSLSHNELNNAEGIVTTPTPSVGDPDIRARVLSWVLGNPSTPPQQTTSSPVSTASSDQQQIQQTKTESTHTARSKVHSLIESTVSKSEPKQEQQFHAPAKLTRAPSPTNSASSKHRTSSRTSTHVEQDPGKALARNQNPKAQVQPPPHKNQIIPLPPEIPGNDLSLITSEEDPNDNYDSDTASEDYSDIIQLNGDKLLQQCIDPQDKALAQTKKLVASLPTASPETQVESSNSSKQTNQPTTQ